MNRAQPSVRLRWLGVAGIELTAHDRILAIDPFFTRPPFWRMAIGRVRPDRALIARHLPRCDWILVTHAHWDHLMDVPDLARRTAATVWGSPNACALLAACGLPQAQIRPIHGGERLVLGDWTVDVLPGEHMRAPGFAPGPLPADLRPPLRLRDYRMDLCFSFALQIGRLRLLDWHSNTLDWAVLADVLFLGPDQPLPYYRQLLRAVRPRLVIPVHWDDLFCPLSRPIHPVLAPPRWAWPPVRRMDLPRFRQEVEQMARDQGMPETEVWIPERFRPYDLAATAREPTG